jgi:hypothetical protein
LQDRHFRPATTDFRHLLQERGPTGLAANPAQSLFNGPFGGCGDGLAGKLRQIPCQTLGFGIFDAEGHEKVPFRHARSCFDGGETFALG